MKQWSVYFAYDWNTTKLTSLREDCQARHRWIWWGKSRFGWAGRKAKCCRFALWKNPPPEHLMKLGFPLGSRFTGCTRVYWPWVRSIFGTQFDITVVGVWTVVFPQSIDCEIAQGKPRGPPRNHKDQPATEHNSMNTSTGQEEWTEFLLGNFPLPWRVIHWSPQTSEQALIARWTIRINFILTGRITIPLWIFSNGCTFRRHKKKGY